MNKRIVFFDGTLREGGAERVISILSNELIDRGFDVSILLYYDDDVFYDIDERINIVSVEKENKSKKIIKNISYIRNYFKNNADIIISFLAPFNMLALFSNAKNNIPIIVADRNDPRYVPNKGFMRHARNILYERYATAVVLQTNDNKEYFNKTIQNKSVVIKNPVDLKEYKGYALKIEKEKSIASVGRLISQKNQLLLIEAFNEVKDDYPDYKLIIYGEGPDRNELQKRINELNIDDKVLLAGNEKNIFLKISSSELFVLSSNFEGMPNSLIEAMCLGLPVISTRVSGANELIDDRENGILCEINNKNELVSSIKEVLGNNELRRKIANNACKLNDELSVDRIVEQWTELIGSILK